MFSARRNRVWWRALAAVIACGWATFAVLAPWAQAETTRPPAVNAKAAVVYDATDRKVLYDKRGDEPMYPASTTKLMTAILLVQHLQPDDPVYISETASRQPRVRLGLRPGTELTAEQALLALIMKSANDVAYGIAETIGGSQEGFARMMNVEARLIGCTHTQFVTPNGLHADAHTTSAKDIALITAKAITYPRIVRAMQTPQATIAGKTIRNGNRLLYSPPASIGEFIGGKTGFTSRAMYCLATAVRRPYDGHILVSVVFGAPRKSLMYRETVRLLTWANRLSPPEHPAS
ncbi:peptidase S11 D-alanyl-D-alanine carboxypeptidase 1 [Alicyclobacillus acidocaldarius subsp. acidocaldarius DSM 446]|uniref:Peptidase S11 D-alanyl-D-alanine carboxypeptidase 1 n=1 Tax=Alicyclobacillus acidocaldarius subsp. acidocaldarius (strain ATCC 27009 / DSM 446 / BCRC 14685 / JCM 5260 / KCTC 1825 / NBRC 15652 / NCIMB 11725 / NRRL B-14509 / 104-IA) TaxID=521098 RepID=C8WQF0_ALIAD|nr:peptidase S11 D-alanyl-D-alanine carboxypeptidase 1 [Alicyclobacillus acidocaldarius subsp. acidocaldarius DSM 446]